MAKKTMLCLLVVSIFLNSSLAATIYGNIYNEVLEKQNDVVLAINTVPKQIIVAKNASYEIEAKPGSYEIRAVHYNNGEIDYYTKETIEIKDEGRYVLDIILFPSFGAEEGLATEAEEFDFSDIVEEQKVINYGLIVGIIVIILILIILIINHKKIVGKIEKKIEKQEMLYETESGDISKDIIKFIRKENGRTTQKEIRDKFPSSEAKISLILTELEHKGIIEKIKKGRGNIIILKNN